MLLMLINVKVYYQTADIFCKPSEEDLAFVTALKFMANKLVANWTF